MNLNQAIPILYDLYHQQQLHHFFRLSKKLELFLYSSISSQAYVKNIHLIAIGTILNNLACYYQKQSTLLFYFQRKNLHQAAIHYFNLAIAVNKITRQPDQNLNLGAIITHLNQFSLTASPALIEKVETLFKAVDFTQPLHPLVKSRILIDTKEVTIEKVYSKFQHYNPKKTGMIKSLLITKRHSPRSGSITEKVIGRAKRSFTFNDPYVAIYSQKLPNFRRRPEFLISPKPKSRKLVKQAMQLNEELDKSFPFVLHLSEAIEKKLEKAEKHMKVIEKSCQDLEKQIQFYPYQE